MKILITGAKGKIGKKLVAWLESKTNHELVLFSHQEKEIPKVDAIIHLAGITHSHDPKKYFQANTKLTKKLLEQAEKKGIKKFIYISSCAASQNGGEYALSKLLAENEVKKFSRSFVILRLSEVYGDKSFHGLEKIITQAKKYSLVILPKKKFSLCPVHINDLLPAFEKTLGRGNFNKSYNLAGPRIYSSEELGKIIKQKIKKNFLILRLPLFIFRTLAFLAKILNKNFLYADQIPRLINKKNYDITNTKKDLDFKPRNLF